jgi:hypothetical protein
VTTVPLTLEPSLQGLLDDRLDAIDRVLLRAGVSRGERRSIVEEVEAHVYEMLSRKTEGDPQRAEVVSVLATLDPPEAYAPEPYRHRVREAAQPKAIVMRRPQPSLLALGSAAGALICAFIAMVLGYVMVEDGFGEVALLLAAVFFPAALAVTGCGILAIVRIRKSEGWLFGLRAGLLAALMFPLLLGNGILIFSGLLFEGFGLVAVAGLAVLTCNAMAVYQIWRMVANGYQRATPVPSTN